MCIRDSIQVINLSNKPKVQFPHIFLFCSKELWNISTVMSKTEKNAMDLLKGAYNLITPDDNKKYYEGFAPFYDSVFVKDLGYTYPTIVANLLVEKFTIDGPICDIGCGTGLVANEIKKKAPNAVIDGVDISKAVSYTHLTLQTKRIV